MNFYVKGFEDSMPQSLLSHYHCDQVIDLKIDVINLEDVVKDLIAVVKAMSTELEDLTLTIRSIMAKQEKGCVKHG